MSFWEHEVLHTKMSQKLEGSKAELQNFTVFQQYRQIQKKILILPTSPISVLSLDHPGSNTPISDSLETKNQEMNEDCFIFPSSWFYFLVCKTRLCIQQPYQMSSSVPLEIALLNFAEC